jgi:beta-phosphoglucomutase-like phosphatase (HAD superfamily)
MCGVLMLFQTCFAEIKAVLFDCDGTLVDSEYAHYLGWKRTLVDLGSDMSLSEYDQYVGKSGQAISKQLAEKIGQDCPELILKRKNQYFLELCKEGLPSIEPTVKFLKCLGIEKESLGIKLAVCSAATKDEIVSHLRHLGVDHLVDIVLSGQEDLGDYCDPEGINKPKPYIYLHAMKRLGVSSDQCVVIEDSATGVEAGVAAKCLTIAIPNEYTHRQDLSQAHLRLESFSDISIERFFQMVEVARVGTPKNLPLP